MKLGFYLCKEAILNKDWRLAVKYFCQEYGIREPHARPVSFDWDGATGLKIVLGKEKRSFYFRFHDCYVEWWDWDSTHQEDEILIE